MTDRDPPAAQPSTAPLPTLGPSPLGSEGQLSVEQARAAVAAALRPLDRHDAEALQTVPLEDALGRVLAEDVVSPLDVPAHDNSAMDGYAFGSSALGVGAQAGPATDDREVELQAVGTVLAGAPWRGTVGAGQAVRIMTGAVMPAGCDTVVPHELCRVDGGQVRFAATAVKAGENRRRQGEDLARGLPALRAGRRLRPADLGLMASLGLQQAVVFRRLRVALFSTGDEIRSPGQPLDPGCVYDSNRASLRAALQRLGVEVVDLGLAGDDPATLRATLAQAVARADVVVTSGGVSMGDADHTRDLLARMGEVGFWTVAMRPGRPLAFGPVRDAGREALLFALPGNPVAALVTFYVFVREALLTLSGASPEPLVTLRARSPVALRKRPGRSEFQRGIVALAADGQWEVRVTGSQGAGILRSLSEANALLVLDHAQGNVAAGEMVEVWLFEGLA